MSTFKLIETGTATISYSVSITGRAAQVEEVLLSLAHDGAADNNLSFTFDSGDGATYDTVAATKDLEALEDHRWAPTRPMRLENGDALVIGYANATGATYGLTVHGSYL